MPSRSPSGVITMTVFEREVPLTLKIPWKRRSDGVGSTFI